MCIFPSSFISFQHVDCVIFFDEISKMASIGIDFGSDSCRIAYFEPGVIDGIPEVYSEPYVFLVAISLL